MSAVIHLLLDFDIFQVEDCEGDIEFRSRFRSRMVSVLRVVPKSALELTDAHNLLRNI